MEAAIYYRNRSRDPLELYANKEDASKTEIRTAARDLLSSLKEEGLRSPGVWIVWPTGRQERVRLTKGGK